MIIKNICLKLSAVQNYPDIPYNKLFMPHITDVPHAWQTLWCTTLYLYMLVQTLYIHAHKISWSWFPPPMLAWKGETWVFPEIQFQKQGWHTFTFGFFKYYIFFYWDKAYLQSPRGEGKERSRKIVKDSLLFFHGM